MIENTATYTYEYALKQIDQLTNRVDHIHLAVSKLGHLENEGIPLTKQIPRPKAGFFCFVGDILDKPGVLCYNNHESSLDPTVDQKGKL